MENQINHIQINGVTRTREEWAKYADQLQYHEDYNQSSKADDIFYVLDMTDEKLIIRGYAAQKVETA